MTLLSSFVRWKNGEAKTLAQWRLGCEGVSAQTLRDALWPRPAPPPRAVGALRTCPLSLRDDIFWNVKPELVLSRAECAWAAEARPACPPPALPGRTACPHRALPARAAWTRVARGGAPRGPARGAVWSAGGRGDKNGSARRVVAGGRQPLRQRRALHVVRLAEPRGGISGPERPSQEGDPSRRPSRAGCARAEALRGPRARTPERRRAAQLGLPPGQLRDLNATQPLLPQFPKGWNGRAVTRPAAMAKRAVAPCPFGTVRTNTGHRESCPMSQSPVTSAQEDRMRRGQVPGPEKRGDDQRRSYDWEEERERCSESRDFCFPPKEFQEAEAQRFYS